jgi:DNA-directed RNA polymerase specialized sigma24 family protein
MNAIIADRPAPAESATWARREIPSPLFARGRAESGGSKWSHQERSARHDKAAELVREWRRSGNRRSLDELVKLSAPLIGALSAKFRARLSREEATQEATLALIEALPDFDETRNVSLFTFAEWRIFSALQVAASEGGMSGFSRQAGLLSMVVKRMRDDGLELDEACEAVAERCAANGGSKNPKRLAELYRSSRGRRDPIRRRADGSSFDLLETVPDGTTEDSMAERLDAPRHSECAALFLDALEPVARRAFEEVRLRDRLPRDVAAELGVSRERLRQLDAEIMLHFRHWMGVSLPPDGTETEKRNLLRVRAGKEPSLSR